MQQVEMIAIRMATAFALVVCAVSAVHAQPHNLNPEQSLCIDLRGVSGFGPACLVADDECGDPQLHCVDNDDNPLNGGLCLETACADFSQPIIADVEIGPSTEPVCAAQLFLAWSPAELDLVGYALDPEGETGFTEEVFSVLNQAAGTLDLAQALPIGTVCDTANGANDGGTIVRLTFMAVTPCAVFDISFRDSGTPTQLSGAAGPIAIVGCNGEAQPSPIDPAETRSPPVWNCPSSSIGSADCDEVLRTVTFPPVSVSDSCGAILTPIEELCTVEYFPTCTGDVDCTDGLCSGGICTTPFVIPQVDFEAFLNGGGQFFAGRTHFNCTYTNICGLSATCETDIVNSGHADPLACDDPTLYVDKNAIGPLFDGSSWCTGFPTLQEALTAADLSGGSVTDILVAEGVYSPADAGGDRFATFEVRDGVSMFGGFSGCGEAVPNERSLFLYETVLSGDLNGDDDGTPRGSADNSIHVVSAFGIGEETVVDGFTISAAFADDKTPHDNGGGVYIIGGSPTVANSTLEGNFAFAGAAASSSDASPHWINCKFSGNGASLAGGGIHATSGAPRITNCTFHENDAPSGGALFGTSTSITVANSIFWNNGASAIVGAADVSYSTVEGGFAGTGNITVDPMFVSVGDGNLRLRANSPAADAGNNAAVPLNVTTDLDGRPRFINDPFSPDFGNGPTAIVDMGAYELMLGDAAFDGDVDSVDFQAFADCVGELAKGPAGEACVAFDFNGDGNVDLADYYGFQISFTGSAK